METEPRNTGASRGTGEPDDPARAGRPKDERSGATARQNEYSAQGEPDGEPSGDVVADRERADEVVDPGATG